jgi:hypothetical protein
MMEAINNTEQPKIEPLGNRNGTHRPILGNYWFGLAAIVAIAVAFRLIFFIGFVGADPQDDAIYINTINSMVDRSYSLAPMRNIIAEGKLDPAHVFQLRMSFLVPEKYLVRIFGHSDFSFTLFPFLCSIGGVILAYCFMSVFAGDRGLGLIAAFLMAVYPLDSAFATKISPEVPLGLFIALTVFFFAWGERQLRDDESSKWPALLFFMAGVFISLSHGMKVFGVILPSFFLLYFLIYRRFRLQHLFIILGFIPYSALLSCYYYIHSGDFFLQNTVMFESQLFNFNAPWAVPMLKKCKLGFLEIVGYYGGLFEYTKYTFAFKRYSRGVVNYFTIYYHLMLLGAIVWAIHFRKHFTSDGNRIIAILLIWAAAGYITLEFAPVSIAEIISNHRYCLFPKEARFHLYLSIPVVCMGAFCFHIVRRYRILMFAGLFFVATISIFSLNTIRNYYHDGIKDVIEAAAYIRAHPEKTYYTDYLANGFLRYQLHYNPLYKIVDVNHLENEEGVGKGTLILGGARGVDVNGSVPLEIIPPWAKKQYLEIRKNNPAFINELHNTPPYSNTRYRKYNMKIFAVAGVKGSNP